jgi:hypothetical protein
MGDSKTASARVISFEALALSRHHRVWLIWASLVKYIDTPMSKQKLMRFADYKGLIRKAPFNSCRETNWSARQAGNMAAYLDVKTIVRREAEIMCKWSADFCGAFDAALRCAGARDGSFSEALVRCRRCRRS